MVAKTDFNVTPYWDDFDSSDNFYRVLFRPGFAVQARELTQLQSILQNQIEQFGNHIFKEGTIVIPGSVGYDDKYYAVKIQASSIGIGSGIVSTYLNQYNGTIITGTTSGVTAQVIGYSVADATTGDPDTLFVKYISSSSLDNATPFFSDDEYISSNGIISSFAAGVNSSQLYATGATLTGSAVTVLEGIYFIRGFMVQNSTQTVVLHKYSNTTDYRIGWNIIETLVTPESDSTLVDNAQGTTNYAAKGSHRLKIGLTLTKKALTDTSDADFVELARVENGQIIKRLKYTEYSIVQDMLARRTSEESGNYIIKHFDIEPREHLTDGTNRGIYTTAQGGLESKAALAVSAGKAYIDGYEVELQSSSYVNIDKARTTKTIQNDSVPFSLGNYAKVENVYNQPDVTEDGSILDPFKSVKLYDARTDTRGAFSSIGAWIGLARTRAFEYNSGTIGTHTGATAALYHHYLFDISMFNIVVVGTASTLTENAVITGVSSGATGVVVAAISSATEFKVMQQTGDFLVGESITSSIAADDPAGIIATATTTTVNRKSFARDVKQLFMDTLTGLDYTADINLDQSKSLGGQVTWTTGTTVNGNNTEFTSDLVVGDIVAFPSGAAAALEERRVDTVVSNTEITIASALTNAITSVTAQRLRGKITEEEETVLVYKMPKDDVKTLLDNVGNSDTSYAFRKQFRTTTTAGSVATFTLPAGETWTSPSLGRNYTLTIVDSSPGGSAAQGDVVDISGIATGSGTVTLTITDPTDIGANTEIELMGTINKAVANHRTKTANKMAEKIIASNLSTGTYSDVYGERVVDSEISLSYADVYKLFAVYHTTSISTAPNPPTLTTTNHTGVLSVGEIITGSSTAATGRVIDHAVGTGIIRYVKIDGTLTALDTITGGSSTYTAEVTATTIGDNNITSSFLLDTGQRDSFYDVGRIARKPGSQTPDGQLLVVYDYFSHGTGDYFSVDSYTGQVDYKDIPDYLASKTDPESRAPVGFYQLRDALDFRPRVKDQPQAVSLTSSPFAFQNKNFEDAGSVNGNMVEPDGSITLDFDHYLGRRNLLYLNRLGNFEIINGVPAENPTWPSTDNLNMLIARVEVPPYTYVPEDIFVRYLNNKGYQMRDIGNLETRIAKLEYATTLGLLERETDSYMILDADGLNRFKSGFIVDNFYGHNVGNSMHSDYNVSVDPGLGHLRPVSVQTGIDLIEENTTTTQRTADGYIKTGDLISLPYEETIELDQPYASRVESVNPYSVIEWVGHMKLEPETDVWMDDDRVPALTINVEGNYEQMLREQRQAGALGTLWNSWNDMWTGNQRSAGGGGTRVERNPNGSGEGGNLIRNVTTEASTAVDVRQRRTGTETRLVERIDNISTGDRVTNIEVVPWMRARDVNFTVTNLKPNTRVYAFFDRVDVNADVKPVGTSSVSTALGQSVGKTDTTITVTSTVGFPISGLLGVGDNTVSDAFILSGGGVQQEQMTYTGITASTFTGVTRNVGNQYDEPQEWSSDTPVTNESYGTQMVSNDLGVLYGRFKVPNTDTKRFRVGRKTFRLTDSDTNSVIGGFVNTSAEAEYQAIGHKQTKQELILATRNGQIGVQQVEQTQNITRVTGGAVTTGAWFDPLAQTVLVEKTGGIFVTSCDVFFSHKDDVLPVWMEVRTVKNGYPTQEILPFSKTTINAADITVNSTDGTTATKFTFDGLVHLAQDQEYAIVLASNSPNYKVWISRLGELEIGGARAISTQPTLGSLFKSQNASTWTASQYEDLKFILRRAKFDVSKTATVVLTNEDMVELSDTGGNGLIPILPANPIEAVTGQSKVKVNFINHGHLDTDNNVEIIGIKSDIGNTTLDGSISTTDTTITCEDVSNFPVAGSIRIDNEIITYTGKNGTTQLTGCVRGTANWDASLTTAATHEDNSIVQLYMFAGIPLIEINKTHTLVGDLELDSFTVATSTPATATVTAGGEVVKVTKNLLADVMQTVIQTMELPSTIVTSKAQTTTSRSVNSATQNAFQRISAASAFDIPLNEDYYFNEPQMICSKINETNELAGNKSYRLTMSLSSTNENVSPILDTQRMFNICISSRLNQIDSSSDIGALTNYKAMTEADGDNNASIYITKKISLAAGATALKLYFDAVKMADADIKVLYKIQRADASIPFADMGWSYFNTDGTPDSTVALSKNRTDFKEYTYFAGRLQNGLGDPLEEFNSFSIKIVLRGKNSSLPPLLKDFRAIALAT
jgi:hypothetical protein